MADLLGITPELIEASLGGCGLTSILSHYMIIHPYGFISP
jgi:hypothetical protein